MSHGGYALKAGHALTRVATAGYLVSLPLALLRPRGNELLRLENASL